MSPNSTCDLHLHTYYSDGYASPAELLRYAANLGLRTIAITDHDNVNGAHESAYVAEELGLELIPAIEFTSRWFDCLSEQDEETPREDVDVLGYFIDPQDTSFLNFTHAALADIRDRISDCCSRLTEAGYPISIYDVLDENPRYPGAVHLISALWKKGYTNSWSAAFPLFITQWQQVRLSNILLDQVISTIHKAGGVAVLAHPISVNCKSGWLQESQLAQLIDFGLDGLEIYHPRLNAEARAYFKSLATRFNLLVTGGSDEHGWSGGFTRIGNEPLPYSIVQNLKDRSLLIK